MLRPRPRDVCAAPLTAGHPREDEQALDRPAAADAFPLEAALLPLDTDFELHRLWHGLGDAAVSRPTTRRVLVVRSRRQPETGVHFWSDRIVSSDLASSRRVGVRAIGEQEGRRPVTARDAQRA